MKAPFGLFSNTKQFQQKHLVKTSFKKETNSFLLKFDIILVQCCKDVFCILINPIPPTTNKTCIDER